MFNPCPFLQTPRSVAVHAMAEQLVGQALEFSTMRL